MFKINYLYGELNFLWGCEQSGFAFGTHIMTSTFATVYLISTDKGCGV